MVKLKVPLVLLNKLFTNLLHGTNANWNLFVPFAQLTFNDKVVYTDRYISICVNVWS